MALLKPVKIIFLLSRTNAWSSRLSDFFSEGFGLDLESRRNDLRRLIASCQREQEKSFRVDKSERLCKHTVSGEQKNDADLNSCALRSETSI